MKKYIILLAGLTATSAFAHGREPGEIGSRLGDGAFMKATGMSATEWAAMCGRHESTARTITYQAPGYSETQRLMPQETPVSTETIQGKTGTVASSANTQSSVSAGSGENANYAATTNDSTPAPADSFTDDHKRGIGASASVSTDSAISKSYDQNHSPIYTDKSDLSAAGAPAKSEQGYESSQSNLNSSSPASPSISPVDTGVSSTSVSPDAAWSAQIKSDLTKETPENTSASTFTSANLQNVNISHSNGSVTLTGTVPTEQMKRELESRVKDLSAGQPVINQLSVAPSADVPANGSSKPRD